MRDKNLLRRELVVSLTNSDGTFKTMRELKVEIVRSTIEACLEACQGNKTSATKALKISRRTLNRYI